MALIHVRPAAAVIIARTVKEGEAPAAFGSQVQEPIQKRYCTICAIVCSKTKLFITMRGNHKERITMQPIVKIEWVLLAARRVGK